ncbi:MAG: Holliday junction branch migration protein RuvA [Bdellovibrionota bacterium]
MIGWIRGRVLQVLEDRLILETSGVGYELFLTQGLLASQVVESEQSFYVYTHVREDQLILFGFPSLVEKEIFLLLMKVSGIGAKTALSLLSSFPSSELIGVIQSKDTKRLTQVKGIGKKAAEKIVIELQDKVQHFPVSSKNTADGHSQGAATHLRNDITSALINLGYKKPVVETAMDKLQFEETISFDQALKESLKMLGNA